MQYLQGVYINLRSRDGAFVRSFVRAVVWNSGGDRVLSLHSVLFGQLLCCAHQRIVNIMKLYIESNNIQVELIRFRKKYRLYTRLLFRTDEVNATGVFTLG